MSERKPRSDSKLDNLPELQFLELRDGLLSRRFGSYNEAADWLLLECGVSTSLSSLHAFYHRHCKPELVARRKFAAMRAEAIGDAMAEADPDYDALAIDLVKEKLFDLLDQPEVDAKAAKSLADIIFKDRTTTTDQRKVSLLEAKANRLDEMEAKAQELKAGGLTPETLELLEKQLKLL